MEIFLDTASIDEVRKYKWLIDGVTTNPSLIARENKLANIVLEEISDEISGPISIEVVSETYDEMVTEGNHYASLVDNAVIKLPITPDGLKVCKALSSVGVSVNMTLCFSLSQAVLAAKCGATYVSPFIGRIDDIGYSGIDVLGDICSVLHNDFSTKVLAASIRSIDHVSSCLVSGVDAITVPPSILGKMFSHPLTDLGILKFKEDYSGMKH